MPTRVRWSASLRPPEPAQTLSRQIVAATSELLPLPRWLELHPLGAMSPSARNVLWSVARHVTGNPDLGFALAERVAPSAMGTLWSLCEAAPSLAALHELQTECAVLLVDCVDCELSIEGEAVLLRYLPDAHVGLERGEQDFRAAMLTKTWRAIVREVGFGPTAVHFCYPRPRSTGAHTRALGTRALSFSQPSFGIELPRAQWEAPLPSGDRVLFAQLSEQVVEAARVARSRPLPLAVDALITELLSRDASAGAVAEVLGISVRTLRRKLAASGLTFRALVEGVQKREAALLEETRALARGSTLSQRERARLLGFTGSGALRNALRRWRGEDAGPI